MVDASPSSRLRSTLTLALASCLTLSLACDKGEAEPATDDKAEANPDADEKAKAKTSGAADGEAAAPAPKAAGACELGPVFAQGCPLSAEEFQALLGTEEVLTLDTSNDDGKCRVMRGNERVAFVFSQPQDAKARTKTIDSFDTQTELGFSDAVDLGLGECPAIFRGSSYHHLQIAGKETFVHIQVKHPPAEGQGKDALAAANVKRRAISEAIAAKLFASLK